MKKHVFLLIIIVLGSLSSSATTTYTVGASRTYTTIAAAYAACTGATDYVLEIYNDYSYSGETGGTAAITFGALASKSSTNTVTIRPASGQSLSFSGTASNMFYLDGANWVIFDGRAGGSGSSAWTMINTDVVSNGQRIFRFVNDASNNVIKYCLIKGRGSSTAVASASTTGLISFGTTTGTTGNDDNTIDHCTIQENTTLPFCAIASFGTAAKENSGNTVSNCNLINFQGIGIYLDQNTDSWTITGNHLYQDQAVSFAGETYCIYVKKGGNYTITGNYIGGQAPSCGGSAFSRSITTATKVFSAISFSSGTSGGTNTISSNTIANMSISSTIDPGGPPVSLIDVEGTGNFVIGSSGNGNVIGATTGTGSISITYNNANGYYTSAFAAINVESTGTTTVNSNTIGAIDYSQTAMAGETDEAALIRISSSGGTVVISNNTLGNSTSNNITITNNSATLKGIDIDNNNTPTSVTINGNTIQNFSVNDGTYVSLTHVYGMYLMSSISGQYSFSVYSNVVKNLRLNLSNPLNNVDRDYAVLGILAFSGGTGANGTVYNNLINNLTSTYSGATQINVGGMMIYGNATSQTFNVYGNKIKEITNLSTNANSFIVGMDVSAYNYDGTGILTTYNNVILLNDTGTDAKKVAGIYISGYNYGTWYFYYNTVRLSGTYSSGSASTSALLVDPGTDYYYTKNNIFQNLITGGSGSHYAQTWSAGMYDPSLIRYNYNEAPNASKLINYGGTDETLANWRTVIGDGSNTEITGSITVSSTTGVVTPSGSVIENAGTPIGGITTDYDLNSRDATNPWMGAFETITPLPIELLSISAKCQKTKTSNSEYGATIQWTTATEKNSYYYLVEGSTDGFVWEVKDTIEAAGTKYDPTSYYYHDDFINPTPENETVVYYRVSQTDFDGVVKTYDILSCKCEASDKIKIHPVPATEYIVINFGDQNNIPNSFQITDMFGRVIEDIVINGEKEGNTSYKLNIQQYASGRYIIKINDWKMKEDAVFIKK